MNDPCASTGPRENSAFHPLNCNDSAGSLIRCKPPKAMPKKIDPDVPPDKTFDFEAPPDPTEGVEYGASGGGRTGETEEDNLAPAPPRDEVLESPPRPVPSVHLLSFLEYSGPNQSRWRCDRVADLFDDYTIRGSDVERLQLMEDWHRVMSGVPAMWKMLRRWYRLAPLTGTVLPEDLREWRKDELAKDLGFSVELLEKQLLETRDHWHHVRMERELTMRMQGPTAAVQLDERQIKELVERFGFSTVPVAEHPYVAMRLTEMSQLFDFAEGRMLAQTAIFTELMIRHKQKAIGLAMSGSATADISKEQAELTKLQTQYEGTLERLGATQEQNPGIRQKVGFIDCLGTITKAIGEYYEKDDTAMIDGIFTASEVKILLTPTTLRPIQYRPDLPLLAQRWKEQFWNVDYVADKLPRKEMQKLMRGFDEGVREQMIADGEALPDMENSEDAELLEMAEQALVAPADVTDGTEDVGTSLPDAGAVMPDAAIGPRRAGGKSDYAVI